MVDLPHRLGKYTLHRRIGGGGMGQVYLATLEGAGGFAREIAVKLVRADQAASPRAIELFLREGRALAALSHRNVVQVFELDAEGDGLYLAMEYLRGLDLSQLRARGPLAWPAAVYIASEAARGLAAAHAARSADAPSGLVHGDISPSNIMVCRDGAVKVLDFGIARPLGLVGVGAAGKLPYMPPETLVGAAADERSDIYGLGLVLYELLQGARVFRGTDRELKHRVLHDAVPRPSSCVQGLPPSLDQLLMSAIARDRSHRPGSAREFADELDRVLAGRFGAADLAELVATLADRPATPGTDTLTPVGRTDAFGPQQPHGDTPLATPSIVAAASRDHAATPSADIVPTRSRGGRIAAIAVAAVLVGGVIVWRMVPRSSAPAPEAPVVPMRATAAPVVPEPAVAVPVAGPAPAITNAATDEPADNVAGEIAGKPVRDSHAPKSSTPPRTSKATARKRTQAATSPTTTRPAAGSGSISPGYLANPFEKK